ncbi:hypothetical protein V8F06_010108 [Rhypophila decipiens]
MRMMNFADFGINTAPPNSAVSAEQLATIMVGRFTVLEAQFQTLQRDVQRDVRSRDSKIKAFENEVKALEDQVKSLRRTQNATISVASKREDAWYLRWDGVKDEFSEVNLKLDGVSKILGIPDEDEQYQE